MEMPDCQATVSIRLLSLGRIAALTGFVSLAAAADGDIDTTFGSDGFILLNSLAATPPINTQVQSMAIDSNGRLVVVGSAQHIDVAGNPADANFLLLRLSEDGAVDTSFAGNSSGYRLVDFDLTGIGAPGQDTATAVAIQHDGKIVAVGNAYFNDTQSHFAAVRVDAAGTLDPTFGGSGSVHFGAFTAYSNRVSSLAIDANGNLVLAGATSYFYGGNWSFYAATTRLTSDGSIDATFNTGLVQSFSLAAPPDTALDSGALALAMDSSGRILVAGNYDTSTMSAAAVERFTTSGLADADFANGAPAPITPPYYSAQALLAEPGGAFMVSGYGFGGGQGYVYLARFLSDGSPDPTFGANGIAAFPFGGGGGHTLIARTRRGGWLIAGPYSQQGVYIAKVLANGQPDTTLNGTGFANLLYQPNTLFDIATPTLMPDGKLVVIGTLPEAAANGVGTIGIMRVLADYDTLFVDGFESR